MKISGRLKIILMVSVVSTALIVLEKFKIPQNTFFWQSILEAGHVPLFGVISIAFLGLSQTLWSRKFSNPLTHYVIAFGLTGLLGLLTEILQYFTPRDADILDVISDAVGGFCFLGLYLTFDRRLPDSGISLSRRLKYILRLSVVVLGLIAVHPTLNWVGAYIYRDISFPKICNFESTLERKFVFTTNASLSIVSAPENFGDNNSYVGRIDFKKHDYSNFSIAQLYPDWSGYDNFLFSVFSPLDDAVTVELRINDWLHNNKYNDRFNRTLSIKPGLNNFKIGLKDIANAPTTRSMDMRKMKYIILFTSQPENEFSLYFDNFRLE